MSLLLAALRGLQPLQPLQQQPSILHPAWRAVAAPCSTGLHTLAEQPELPPQPPCCGCAHSSHPCRPQQQLQQHQEHHPHLTKHPARSLLRMQAHSFRTFASSAGEGAAIASSPDTSSSNSSISSSTTTSTSSSSSSSSSSSEQPQPPLHGGELEEHAPLSQDVHYEGPLAKTHKLLKRISLSNTALALAAAPAIVMYADASYATRIGLATSLAFFGLMTTGALHWITRPYVHELKFKAQTQELDVKTTTLLSRTRWSHFALSDVQPLPWNRPVATFVAKGNYYYIDVYSFPDEDLLKRLTPEDVPEGYKEDKDED